MAGSVDPAMTFTSIAPASCVNAMSISLRGCEALVYISAQYHLCCHNVSAMPCSDESQDRTARGLTKLPATFHQGNSWNQVQPTTTYRKGHYGCSSSSLTPDVMSDERSALLNGGKGRGLLALLCHRCCLQYWLHTAQETACYHCPHNLHVHMSSE